MHLKNYCFVRQQDYSAPEPPQKHSPEAFLGWLAKQLKLAREVVVCYEAGCFGYEPARPMPFSPGPFSNLHLFSLVAFSRFGTACARSRA